MTVTTAATILPDPTQLLLFGRGAARSTPCREMERYAHDSCTPERHASLVAEGRSLLKNAFLCSPAIQRLVGGSGRRAS